MICSPMTDLPIQPPLTRFVQAFGSFILHAWLGWGFRIRIRRQRAITDDPVVYACNHRSFADPPVVGMCSRRPISYFARESLWRVPIIREALLIMQGIPVDRVNPGMSSMKGAIARLRGGTSVLIFPEGTRTRSGRLGPLLTGPAMIARRAGVPVVPIYVHRTEACWPIGSLVPRLCGPRVQVRFGPALRPEPGLDPRQQDELTTRRLSVWMHQQERELRPDR